MNEPKMFEDEIQDRLRDLKDGDRIIIRHGSTTEALTCRESATYEDGIVSRLRRFETANRSFVTRLVDRLYDYLESGCDVSVIIDGVQEPFYK